jgi:hypothetical protein
MQAISSTMARPAPGRPEALECRDTHQDDEDGGEDQRHTAPDIVRRWIGAYLHVPRRLMSQGGAP